MFDMSRRPVIFVNASPGRKIRSLRQIGEIPDERALQVLAEL
jgi:hypothetical protein